MEGYTSHIAQVAEVSIEGGRVKVYRITCVIDCGQTANPRIVESQLESGIIFGRATSTPAKRARPTTEFQRLSRAALE